MALALALLEGCGQRGIRACSHPTTAYWQDYCDLITEAAYDRTEALGCEQPTNPASGGTLLYGGVCFGSRTSCREQAEDCAAVIDAAPTCEEVERVWRTCLSG